MKIAMEVDEEAVVCNDYNYDVILTIMMLSILSSLPTFMDIGIKLMID